jgi:hypothetical protein
VSGPPSLRRSVASSLPDDAQRQALENFQQARKPDADAIADMAVENFVEMRDKVGDPAFLYKKRVEQTVHGLFPDLVTPQYNLVSFSTVPYTEARRRGRELEGILQRIIARLPREAAAGMSDEVWGRQIKQLASAELAGVDHGSAPPAGGSAFHSSPATGGAQGDVTARSQQP